MNTKSHVGFWLALFLGMFLLNPLLRNHESMERFVVTEMSLTRSTFGDRTADWLSERASIVYNVYTPAGSVAAATVRGEDMRRTMRVVPGPGVAATKAFNGYVEGLVLNFLVAVHRFFIFLIWFLVLAPVFVASVIDGLVQRAIKRSEFGAIRPAAYSVTSMTVIPMAMAPLIYLALPLPITPLVSPLWALLMIMPLSAMVSNMQPIFGRN